MKRQVAIEYILLPYFQLLRNIIQDGDKEVEPKIEEIMNKLDKEYEELRDWLRKKHDQPAS